MTWRSVSTPLVAACLLGALIALRMMTKPPAWSRLSKAEKRAARRRSRKRGRTTSSKRTKRNDVRARLVQEIGVDEFKKILNEERRQKEEQRDRLQAAIDDPDALRLVVDLNWAEGAPGKELSSLVKQLCYVYGRVKASAMPPRLTLTSYRGRAAASLDNAGAASWLVDRNPLGVCSVFDRAHVIYLSPDAQAPLEDVTTTDVYVVGGIVDRNIEKGLTLAAAEGANVRAVRLPFDEHLPEVSSKDRVLTVCACIGVLMSVHAGADWREALKKSVVQRGVEKAARRVRGGAWRGVPGSDGSGWGPGKVGVGTAVPNREGSALNDSGGSSQRLEADQADTVHVPRGSI